MMNEPMLRAEVDVMKLEMHERQIKRLICLAGFVFFLAGTGIMTVGTVARLALTDAYYTHLAPEVTE